MAMTDLNTFEQTVRGVALNIWDEGLFVNLCDRSKVKNQTYAKLNGIGQSVEVVIPSRITGTLWDGTGTITAGDIDEDTVDVDLEYFANVRIPLTGLENTFSLTSLNKQVIEPAFDGVLAQMESYIRSKLNAGFVQNLVGTAGNDPSTLAHILAARKKVFDNTRRTRNLVSIVDSQTDANFLEKDFMNNTDYIGQYGPEALREAKIGRTAQTDFYTSPFCGTFDRGDIAGTVLIDGDPGTTNTIHIDALTAATGTIYAGTRFTVADDTSGNTYTVTADATIASNECDLTVTPAADATIADGKAVTFISAHKENFVYDKDTVTTVILPVVPDENVISVNYKGIGMSLIRNLTSTSNLSKEWTIGAWIGSKVIRPEFGCIMQG